MNDCVNAELVTNAPTAEATCTNNDVYVGVLDVEVNGVSVVANKVASLNQTKITESEIDAL